MLMKKKRQSRKAYVEHIYFHQRGNIKIQGQVSDRE